LLVAPIIENDVRQPNDVRLDIEPFYSSVVIRFPCQPEVIPRLHAYDRNIKPIYVSKLHT